MRDPRSIKIPAPGDSGGSPPPRRTPQIVEPDVPANDPEATVAAGVPIVPKADAGTPGATRRIVVPAPGADAPAAPPSPPADSGAPSGDQPPPGEPPAPPTQQGWRRFLPSWKVVTAVAAVLVLLAGGVLLWAYSKFNSIDTIDLADVLASGDGTNYLIVGSDTREGVDPDDPNAGAIIGDNTVGGPERSDTILILRVDGDGSRMLSVPRDLFVTISETGDRTRINAAFNGGPRRLIATLRDQLDLPIHHYLEVDFVSFAGMVDAVGGITIDFPHPAFDTHSGLNVPEAGAQVLDGTQALAYVRSRFYTEVIDGREVRDPTGDIGRVARQQAFLSAVMSSVGGERNPFRLRQIADELSAGMRIDSDLGFLEAVGLLRRMQGLEAEPNSLPVFNFRANGGAAVLGLQQPGADEVLAQFGSSGSLVE